MTVNRRTFLKGLSASAVSAASIGTLTNGLASFSVNAQTAQDYKALVCVFLFGGMDNHDLILPYDQTSYDEFARIRASMITHRQRDQLLPLTPLNASDFAGRQFALPAQMTHVHQLFQQGNAAIIGNIGPLVEPTSKAQLENSSVRLPPRLFSHNDQQAVWQASAPEGAQFGWGGLFADALQGVNSGQGFTNIATDGSGLFLTGQSTSPYQVSTDGASRINLLDVAENDADSDSLLTSLRQHFGQASAASSNVIMRDVARKQNQGFASNTLYDLAVKTATPLTTKFAADGLSSQLQTVAQTISIRDALGVSRQVFFVTLGGFDTHDDQAQRLPALQSSLDNGIASFQQAMAELGLTDQVTLFTASDFGRTLAVNGDGTDHGWGAHHLVVGGAVQGQQIYGQLPPATFGHEWDAGGGRLIPSLSVEQIAAPLGRWFGMNETQILSSLPNLANFTDAPLTFI